MVSHPGFWSSRIHPDDRQATLDAAQSLMRDGGELAPYRFRIHDGRYLWLQSSIRIERDAHGHPVRMYGLTLDVTRYKRAEEELARLNRELAQKVEHILELSAPLCRLARGGLVLPLIGTLDPGRTQHALGQLLDRVVVLRARRVIIDLTGVAQADAQSVAALLRATQALRLLGASPASAGIRAEIALAPCATTTRRSLPSRPTPRCRPRCATLACAEPSGAVRSGSRRCGQSCGLEPRRRAAAEAVAESAKFSGCDILQRRLTQPSDRR